MGIMNFEMARCNLVMTLGVLCNFLSVGSFNGGPPGHR